MPDSSDTTGDTLDPFASLYTQTHQLHISGQLTLVRSPTGTCGEWVSANNIWHRVLTPESFAYLRDRVKAAIESSGETEALLEASCAISRIKQIGIDHECLPPDIDSFQTPQWFEFNSGRPDWADSL